VRLDFEPLAPLDPAALVLVLLLPHPASTNATEAIAAAIHRRLIRAPFDPPVA
jgi:hypothetical protein